MKKEVTKFGTGRIGKEPLVVLVEQTDEEIAEEIAYAEAKSSVMNRSRRDELLSMSDWTQGTDSPLTGEKKTEWATYRASLRSITDHENWPNLEDDDWPTEPS